MAAPPAGPHRFLLMDSEDELTTLPSTISSVMVTTLVLTVVVEEEEEEDMLLKGDKQFDRNF